MPESWDEHAENWDDDADAKFYAEQTFASLNELLNIRDTSWKSKRVLDFGCGTGLLAAKIAPHVKKVVAVDTSEKMIAALTRKRIQNVTTIHADVLDSNFQHEGNCLSDFDLVYASSVCSFLTSYEHAVAVLTRALKQGGHFVQWDWQASTEDGFGLTENQISNALTRARLSSVRVQPTFAIHADGQTMPVLIGTGVR
ncbi:MAG: class I SAM-dependent methyltransferase [Roseovarius sp.]|nr:class I SAM-dependent methyltransferase [Roseovarius sp.]